MVEMTFHEEGLVALLILPTAVLAKPARQQRPGLSDRR
jgi:hypothetical protein